MYNSKKFLGIIPARGGSKGIPNKNIIKINGIPLIAYTINEAKKSNLLDKIIVSTDSYKIAEIALQYDVDVPFIRSKELACDDTETIDVIIDAINRVSVDEVFDYVVLLQPTQPLRRSFHIDEAIVKLLENNLNSIVSVNEVIDNPILIRQYEEKVLKKVINQTSTIRRQNFPKYYKINGAIYIHVIDTTLDNNTSFNDIDHPYFMESQYDLDIDESFDLEIFKQKLRYLKKKGDIV